MLVIPSDLSRWHPNRVTAWLTDLANQDDVTDDEFAAAQEAGHRAIVGEDEDSKSADILPFSRRRGSR